MHAKPVAGASFIRDEADCHFIAGCQLRDSSKTAGSMFLITIPRSFTDPAWPSR